MSKNDYIRYHDILGVVGAMKNIQWLLNHDITAQKIANLGCSSGHEALALMCVFRANEVFGIDKNETLLRDAKNLCVVIKEQIKDLQDRLQTQQKDAILDELWGLIPPLLKTKNFPENFQIEFEKGDVAHPTCLKQGHYHLAFCRRVLHHIWYDEGREKPQGDTQTAINEIARIVRSGGIVASDSIVQFGDKPKADFSELFKRARLTFVYREEREVFSPEGPALAERYIFQKPNPAK